MTKAEMQEQRERAIERLREIFPPGSLVPTVLRYVSRTGMLRAVSVLSLSSYTGRIHDVSGLVAQATGFRLSRQHGGVEMRGYGMNMEFWLVYNLSRALYPGGFTCTGEDCPSNEHTNGGRDYSPHQHREGSYALRQYSV